MSNTNKISAVLPEADKTATLALLEQVKTKLPFLISTPEAERPKRKMGAKSVEYVNLCLEAASGDSMKAADRVYELLKAAEKTDGSVSEILRRIAQFYSGQSKPRAKKTNP